MNSMQQRERWMWISLGGAMMLPLLWKRSAATLALGGGGGYLAWRAARGESPIGRLQLRGTRETTSRSVTILASPEKVYSAWRRLEDMPRYFPVLENVRELDRRRSEWRLRAGGRTFHWESEITDERPNERLAWRSLSGSNVSTSGSVWLHRAPDDRGTVMEMTLDFHAPGAGALAALLTPFGEHPEQVVREGLRRFKQWVETGEIATIEGQPHGPRSPLTKLLPYLEPGRPHRAERPSEPARRTGTL